ncbi:MAG: alanine racemase [Candidatus Magasanikbacteria bacterium]|nr:alanine racemase [Candidatus Magasanikbacteria bacterium]
MLTWVEVNKQAIEHNLKQFKELIGAKTLLMPVIKSNAYGHGLIEVAKICQQSREVDRICVVNLDEAIELIQNGIKKPIMILSFYELDADKIKIAIKNKVIFPIYRKDQIKLLQNTAKKLNHQVKIHLKIDIGTSRLGIFPNGTLNFARKIINSKNLILEGIWSHFASSETDREHTIKQKNIFEKTIDDLEQNKIFIPLKHAACSAATILHPDTHFNAIRVGISTYGLYPDKKSKKNIDLKPALSLNTKIIQVKTVPPNTKISYGGTFVTKKKTVVATLPIGYWDGLDRRMSNNGKVLINGQRCPILGRICMNLMMVDATKAKNIKVGQTATIIGQQKKHFISADEIARNIGTINYEIVDKINPLIKRVIK